MKYRYYELTKEEEQILRDYEKGLFKKVPNQKEKIALFRSYARNTLNKLKSINIRVSERDVRKMKAIAMRKGIPYQTLISSIIHQYGEE